MNIPNFDYTNILKKKLNKNIKQAKRGQVYVGFQCHQECGFCYYKSKCHEKMFDIDTIKKQIDSEYDYGIRDFEITGGEPSEHRQLKEICQYIKDKNKTSKIAVITNGGLWKCNIWNLIDEVLISYHLGKNTQYYDINMFPLGCTYDKVKKTINKANENNILIRTNTVLGTFNIQDIHDIVVDLIEFKPQIINFLPINLFDQAKNMDKFIDYFSLRKNIKREIDFIKTQLINTLIFIRYMPFCDMAGYEQHIMSNLQHIYDWFDWNVELNGTNLLNLDFQQLGSYGSTSFKTILTTRNQLYEKSIKCIKCKYQLLCDGVEKTSTHELLKYVNPIVGKIITDPMYYIGTKIQDFYYTYYI